MGGIEPAGYDIGGERSTYLVRLVLVVRKLQ